MKSSIRKIVKIKSRTPKGYRPRKHYARQIKEAVPAHRAGLVNFLHDHMKKCGFNMLQLNKEIGYEGRSVVWMVCSGQRALPLNRVDDFAQCLRMSDAETDDLRTHAIHAGGSPEAYALYLKARDGAQPGQPGATLPGPDLEPKRVLFLG